MSTRNYVQVTVDDVVTLYEDGMNFSQIARELGCCRNTVRRKVRQYVAQTGGHIYVCNKPHTSGYSPQDICALKDEGLSVPQIAQKSGLSESYIYRVVKEYTDASR